MDKKGIKKITDIFWRILSSLCLIVLFFVAIFLLFYIITNQVARSKGEYPLVSLYTIVSPSMEPTIKVYDVIVEFKVDSKSDLKVGDIITFYSSSIDTGGYTVTHRIKEIKTIEGETYYITKGDNNQSEDEGMITFDDIVGKVRFKIKGLGRIQFFVSSKLGWLIIILIPALGIILVDIIKLRKIFGIKKQIEEIPQLAEVEKFRETEENKKVRALIEKADRFNKK